MLQQHGRFRSFPLSRIAGHAIVMGAVATTAAYSVIGFGAGPSVELVSTAHGNDSSPSSTSAGALLVPSIGELSQGERSTLSGRAPAGSKPSTPLPTPVPVDPDATPLPAPVHVEENAAPFAGAPAQPTVGIGSGLTFPVPGGWVSQGFRAGHLGIDIAAAPGMPVVASEGGLVTWAGWRNNGGGLVVEIDHGNGMTTVYNHLGSIGVSAGQSVGRGGQIAGMGCTGVCFGPHVQFDVRINGRLIDPSSLL